MLSYLLITQYTLLQFPVKVPIAVLYRGVKSMNSFLTPKLCNNGGFFSNCKSLEIFFCCSRLKLLVVIFNWKFWIFKLWVNNCLCKFSWSAHDCVVSWIRMLLKLFHKFSDTHLSLELSIILKEKETPLLKIRDSEILFGSTCGDILFFWFALLNSEYVTVNYPFYLEV